MNTNTNTPVVETTVAPVAQRHYKKTVIEMYTEAVDKAVSSKKSATQLSASGHEYSGLNKAILNEAKAELGFKSNKWFSTKQMQEANLVAKFENDFGVILFSTILKEIEGSKKKTKVIKYYRVFNEDSLENLPL
ncbi:MAG: ArdC-like ssDNA-binding domain-containing protein [Campylobacterales bacterium]|nr:ArdC-like ssDNA-binding domain-containing protein [Campylobacterales bacterium]